MRVRRCAGVMWTTQSHSRFQFFRAHRARSPCTAWNEINKNVTQIPKKKLRAWAFTSSVRCKTSSFCGRWNFIVYYSPTPALFHACFAHTFRLACASACPNRSLVVVVFVAVLPNFGWNFLPLENRAREVCLSLKMKLCIIPVFIVKTETRFLFYTFYKFTTFEIGGRFSLRCSLSNLTEWIRFITTTTHLPISESFVAFHSRR